MSTKDVNKLVALLNSGDLRPPMKAAIKSTAPAMQSTWQVGPLSVTVRSTCRQGRTGSARFTVYLMGKKVGSYSKYNTTPKEVQDEVVKLKTAIRSIFLLDSHPTPTWKEMQNDLPILPH